MSTSTEPTTWAQTRSRFAELFDASPGFVDDQAIGDAFGRHPAAVIAELDDVASSFAAGRVHSPWRIMARRLAAIERDHRPVSSNEIGRDRRVHLAELRIANLGPHLRDERDVDAELFGERCLLAGLDELRPRMLELWRAERPRGVALELERAEWAQRWKDSRRRPAVELEPEPEP